VNKSSELTIGYGLLVGLTAAAPVLTVSSGWLAPELLTLAVAALLFVLFRESAPDLEGALAISKPLGITALLPALWIVLQLIPVPLNSMDHPIWRSAAAALSESLPGHVSVDLGYSLRGLTGYLTIASLLFAAIILTRSRERAQTLLIALCTVMTFAAIELLLLQGSAIVQAKDAPRDMADALIALVSFGAILNVAGIVRVAERYETRYSRPEQPLRSYIGMGLATIGGAMLCLITLLYVTTLDTVISVLFGLAFLCTVIAARRLRLARWTTLTVFAAVFIVCGGVVTLRFAADDTVYPMFRFVGRAVTDDESTAILRMLADVDWTGTGVGTYRAIAAIYRDGSGYPAPAPPNTVSSLILEWGYAGALSLIVLILQILTLLLRGALSRGRDEFYAAGAAACLVTLLCEAFCNPSLTHAAVQLTAAIIVGVGISQTAGHKSGLVG
jgi:hypothetical protein